MQWIAPGVSVPNQLTEQVLKPEVDFKGTTTSFSLLMP
jgi:hypothetical protein